MSQASSRMDTMCTDLAHNSPLVFDGSRFPVSVLNSCNGLAQGAITGRQDKLGWARLLP